MWNIPTQELLDHIPRLDETEDIPLKEKMIFLHFFIGDSDWYVTKYDGEDLFSGYAILNGDYEMSEWGYVSFAELKSICVLGMQIDCEVDWTRRKAVEVEKISIAHGWNLIRKE